VSLAVFDIILFSYANAIQTRFI